MFHRKVRLNFRVDLIHERLNLVHSQTGVDDKTHLLLRTGVLFYLAPSGSSITVSLPSVHFYQ